MKEIRPKERGKTKEDEIIEQLIMVGLMKFMTKVSKWNLFIALDLK